jgi:inner membrane protein
MLGRTHFLSGQVAWLGLAPLATGNLWHVGLGIPIAAIGALGPDIDHGGSTVSRRMWGPFHYRMGSGIAGALGGHRMGAHSVWSVAFVWVALSIPTSLFLPDLFPWVPLAYALGWATHILGDLFTEHGVGVLYPYTKRRYRLASITTGGGVELAIRFLLHIGRVVLAMLATGISFQALLQ